MQKALRRRHASACRRRATRRAQRAGRAHFNAPVRGAHAHIADSDMPMLFHLKFIFLPTYISIYTGMSRSEEIECHNAPCPLQCHLFLTPSRRRLRQALFTKSASSLSLLRYPDARIATPTFVSILGELAGCRVACFRRRRGRDALDEEGTRAEIDGFGALARFHRVAPLHATNAARRRARG